MYRLYRLHWMEGTSQSVTLGGWYLEVSLDRHIAVVLSAAFPSPVVNFLHLPLPALHAVALFAFASFLPFLFVHWIGPHVPLMCNGYTQRIANGSVYPADSRRRRPTVLLSPG